jgi:DNA polymerase-4
MILHIDMDAFFASIEQAINPRLKDKPLIVGSRNNRLHTVICAASYEAKRLGIGSGMSSKEAFQICPELEFVCADQGRYIWTSEEIFEMLKGYGLPLSYTSIDEFQMDIAGYPEEQPLKLAEDIRARIYANFNITASVGIAKNWLLAKTASKINKPNGITLINDNNLKEVLGRTPLEKVCGMAGKTGILLKSRGLKTALDLYLQMPAFFQENPGKSSEKPEKPKSIGHSYTLPRALENPQVIRAWIRLLSEMVGERLRHNNLAAKTVHLWLNGPEIGNFASQKASNSATNDSFELYTRNLKIACQALQKRPKIRALGVTVSQLIPQEPLFLFPAEERREGLIKALDRINRRFGDGSIYPAQVDLTRKIR